MTNERETVFTLIRDLVREASPSSLPRIFFNNKFFLTAKEQRTIFKDTENWKTNKHKNYLKLYLRLKLNKPNNRAFCVSQFCIFLTVHWLNFSDNKN